MSTGFVAGVFEPLRVAGPALLQPHRQALVVGAELDADELQSLVDAGVRDPACVAGARHPAKLAEGVLDALATQRLLRAAASRQERARPRDAGLEEAAERREDRVSMRVPHHGLRLVN